MVPREVDYDVVALAGPGEILPGVVDDPIRADRPERVQLPGGIHTGHVRSVCLGELHREGPYGPSGTVDQDPLSRPDSPLIANTLHRDRSGGGDGRGLCERETGRLQLEPGFLNGRVLGEGAAVAPQVDGEALTEDLITRPEPRHVRADRLDVTGQIRARNAILGLAQPRAHDPEDVGLSSHDMPDIGMDRCRTNADQHLVVPGHWLVDLAELQDVG